MFAQNVEEVFGGRQDRYFKQLENVLSRQMAIILGIKSLKV